MNSEMAAKIFTKKAEDLREMLHKASDDEVEELLAEPEAMERRQAGKLGDIQQLQTRIFHRLDHQEQQTYLELLGDQLIERAKLIS